jgi:NitT/TauT family transport system ATP-binding protein
MDEPFSALDEFTKLRLHEDILRIFEQTDKTIVFVTHNIGEAVYLSDRICVLSTNPARISALVEVELPRPRTENTLKTLPYFNCVTETRNLLEENYNENL